MKNRFNRPRRRDRRWVAAAVLVVIGLATTAYFTASPRTRQVIGTLSQLAVVRSGLVAPPTLKPLALTVAHGPNDFELCGGGWFQRPTVAAPAVQVEGDGVPEKPLIDPVFMATVAKVMNASRVHGNLVERLRAAPGERARATALIVDMTGLDQPIDPFLEHANPDPAPAREALAKMAVSTTDAGIYAMAFQACRAAANEGTCGQVNAAQWARLDPANAAPWMALLDDATKAHDAGATAEALHRIGTSARSELRYFTTVAQVLQVAPDDDASLIGVDQLVVGLMGVQAAVSTPAVSHLTAACKGDALRDANRAQTCEAIAELFAQRSDTHLERGVGMMLGKQLGWPAERTERMSREQSAYAASLGWMWGDEADFGCRAIRRRVGHMRVVATQGEVSAMQSWLVASGKTDADLRREDEQRRAGLARAFAAAASAKAAPH